MEMTRNQVRKYGARVVVATTGLLLPFLSRADALTEIAAAETTALAIVGALVALVIGVWAAGYAMGFFGKKKA